MLTPEVEFSKCSINILHVVKFVFRNVKFCKRNKIYARDVRINFPADKKYISKILHSIRPDSICCGLKVRQSTMNSQQIEQVEFFEF